MEIMTNLDGISLQDRVIRLFKDRLNLQVSSPETDLLEIGLLDSLTFVQLLFHIEQEFGVTVCPSDLELENFRSVSQIAQFVAMRK
jgi:acyl carrier protein